MAGYNSDANPATLAEAIAQDSKLRGEAYSRLLEASATRHNCFAAFTAGVDKALKGIGAPFVRKRDLRAGGGDRVNFNSIGTPSGPGVKGSAELTGNTSKSSLHTWPVRVGWYRDAVEYTKDQFSFLSAGRMLMSTTIDLLGKKMGMHEQNDMMMRLIKDAGTNVLRPNNRATDNELQYTDTLSLDFCTPARELLTTNGAPPIRMTSGPNGSPIHGYLVFGSQTAFVPIRNDSGFQDALSQGHNRGEDNANFTGHLIDWQGMPFYEMLVTDEAWDGYIGSPMLPKAKNNVEFSTSSASGDCKLIMNSSNTKEQYFQFFSGYPYKFFEDDSPSADSTVYYAWAINPDGSVVFLSYTGSDNDGNTITIKEILATAGGTSTKGTKTLGNLSLGTTPTVSGNVITPDGDATVPTGYTYSDKVQAGAVILQANSRGVQLGRSFLFGKMAAAFAYGMHTREVISQDRDYGFVKGRGFETVFGTGVCKNALGNPVNYLVIPHAIQHAAYLTPYV